VLEELPDRVLQTRRALAARAGRDAVDGLVEADVRFFLVENARELLAKPVVAHETGL